MFSFYNPGGYLGILPTIRAIKNLHKFQNDGLFVKNKFWGLGGYTVKLNLCRSRLYQNIRE